MPAITVFLLYLLAIVVFESTNLADTGGSTFSSVTILCHMRSLLSQVRYLLLEELMSYAVPLLWGPCKIFGEPFLLDQIFW